MFKAEVRDKHAYDIVADGYGILWIIVLNVNKSRVS